MSTNTQTEARTVVVTGAGRGIGRAIAEFLADQGDHVVCVDPGVGRGGQVEDEAVADGVVESILARGGKATADNRSVSDFDEAAAIVESAHAISGRLDAIINCAGILREKMIWNMGDDDWSLVTGVHLDGTFNMCRHSAGIFREQRSGRIINMASTAWLGTVGQSNYGASKGGIVSLTYALARELGKYGVTANAVCPSAGTRMTMTPQVEAGMEARRAHGLITEEQFQRAMNPPGPEHIAPLVAFLLSDAAADVNGQVFKSHKGHVGRYSTPAEVTTYEKPDEAGMITLADLEEAFRTHLLDGYVNPSPVEQQ